MSDPVSDQKKKDPAAKSAVRKPAAAAGKKPAAAAGPKKAVAIPGLDALMPLVKNLPADMQKPVLIGGIAMLAMFVVLIGSAVFAPAPVMIPQAAPPQEQAAAADAGAPAVAAVPEYVGPKEELNKPLDPDAALPMMEYVQDSVKPLSRDVTMSRDQFYEKSDSYEFDDLQGDKYLAYRIRLPKGWSQVTEADLQQLQLSNRVLGVLAYFTSPPDLALRSSLRIKAQKLAHMMNARDWLYQYALANHLTLQGLSAVDDKRAEGVYVITENDLSYVVRVAVVVNGRNVVMAEYYVPMDKFQDEREMQIWSMTSFHLKYKDTSVGEPLKQLNFFDIATVDYPASWELQRSNIKSLDNMDASIVNVKIEQKDVMTRLMGRIDVFMVAANDNYSPEAAMETINKAVDVDKLRVGEAVARFMPLPNKYGLSPVSARVYKINNAENTYQDYQYWIAAVKGKNYYYYICLLTPPRSYEFYTWVRNVAAYQFALQTVREGG